MTSNEGATAPDLQNWLHGAALSGDWTLDRSRSSVSLTNRSVWGMVPVTGVFRHVAGQGTVTVDGEVTGTLTVAPASVDTRNTRRDKHLRSADFFDTDHYPEVTFTVDGIRASGPRVAVTGTLTVRGRALPLAFDGTAAVRGDGEVWLDAQVPVHQGDIGLTWNFLRMVSATTTVSIHAVFTSQ
jgi:polyisoprenoid-binding protein YceI